MNDDTWGAIRNTPGRDRVRGTEHQAHAVEPARGREHPPGQGRGHRGGARKRSRPRLEYEVDETVRVKKVRSPTSPARSPRSTRTSSSSRCWSTSSAGRPRSSSSSARWPSSSTPIRHPHPGASVRRRRRPSTRSKVRRHPDATQEEGAGHRQDPARGRFGHARPAGGHGPRPTRRADHGVLQAVQRGHREHAGPGRAGRHHHLRGPLVQLRAQDVAHAGAAAPGRRPGRRAPPRPAASRWAPSRTPSWPRSPTPR